MNAPKILPWVAHKNGITDQHALSLWRLAAFEAEEISGCCDSSDYFRLAIHRFNELADEEGHMHAASNSLVNPPFISSISWLLREQNHFWQLNLLATQKACRFWLSDLKPYREPGTGLLNMPNLTDYFQGRRQWLN